MRTISLALMFGASVAASVSGCIDDGDLDTSTAESNSSVYQWTNDVRTGGSSAFQPGLAPFGGRLHMLSNTGGALGGATGRLTWQRFNGDSWTPPVALSQYADYGPSVAVFNNRLVAVYHAGGQNRLAMTTSDGTADWTAPVNAGTTLDAATLRYAPSIAVRSGALFAAYCLHDAAGDHIRIDRFVTAWSTVKQFNVGGTCKHVALALEPDGRFRMLYTAEYGSNVWGFYETRDAGGNATTWSTPTAVPGMYSKKPPAMVTCGGHTHMVHGGYSSPSEIWWSEREDGAWDVNQKVPNQVSDGGAALGCFQGTRAIMVHNGGYDDLWWSEFAL